LSFLLNKGDSAKYQAQGTRNSRGQICPMAPSNPYTAIATITKARILYSSSECKMNATGNEPNRIAMNNISKIKLMVSPLNCLSPKINDNTINKNMIYF